MLNIGFIGTGEIGNPMAEQILKAGYPLSVFDLDKKAAENLLGLGAKWASSIEDIARKNDVVFTSLPGPTEVEAVICQPGGLISGASKGLIHVDLSTSSIVAVKRAKERELEAGIHFLDAPVSGGAVGARNASLSVMVSGDKAAFDTAEAVIKCFGGNVFYLGEENGKGTMAKLINNAILFAANQVVQEGLVLGKKAGFEMEELHEILKASSSASHLGMMPLYLSRKFDKGFPVKLAEKDLAMALESARALHTITPAITAAHQTFLKSIATGRGHKMFAATLETLEQDAGI
ncbi:MAG: NAD(P)-dependent oxidoreductase [Pseudomonadales bacterium]|nr:NAD(P)-dependent oxidoreductase [Pseudomonadales bacterium]